MRLWASAPITIIHPVPSSSQMKRTAGGHSSVGAMPRSYQVTPAILAGGGRQNGDGQSHGRQPALESARRRTRTLSLSKGNGSERAG